MWPYRKPVLPKAEAPTYVVNEPRKIGDDVPVNCCLSMPAEGSRGEYWIAEGGKVIWTGSSVQEFCAVVRAGAHAVRS